MNGQILKSEFVETIFRKSNTLWLFSTCNYNYGWSCVTGWPIINAMAITTRSFQCMQCEFMNEVSKDFGFWWYSVMSCGWLKCVDTNKKTKHSYKIIISSVVWSTSSLDLWNGNQYHYQRYILLYKTSQTIFTQITLKNIININSQFQSHIHLITL